MNISPSNRELLELAAKAVGLEGYRYCTSRRCMAEWMESDGGWFGSSIWNPHYNDGDAFRLEVVLKLSTAWDPMVRCWSVGGIVNEEFKWLAFHQDRRLATVTAAAEVGKILT